MATRVSIGHLLYRAAVQMRSIVYRLPLDPIMIFISEVVQKVEDMQRQNTVPSAESLRFLSSVHLDHVLPNKPPITSRRFVVSIAVFFHSNHSSLILFASSGPKLQWYG